MREELAELFPEALVADGFDDAIIGYVEQAGADPVALYDRDIMLAIMIERDGMTYDEALEYFDYNMLGFGGENMPVYATLFSRREIE